MHVQTNNQYLILADVVGDIYLPFLSLDALYGADQVFLDRTDDGSSESIDVGEDGFPFGDSVQTELYVCDENLDYKRFMQNITYCNDYR